MGCYAPDVLSMVAKRETHDMVRPGMRGGRVSEKPIGTTAAPDSADQAGKGRRPTNGVASAPSANAAVARRGAERLGWSHGFLRRNARGCVGSGVCVFGCPASAKQHTGITYLPRADAAGARSFWIAEHLGYREAFVTATAIALATEKARILPTAISPYLRHPTPMAMALATLAELVKGHPSTSSACRPRAPLHRMQSVGFFRLWSQKDGVLPLSLCERWGSSVFVAFRH